PAAPAGSAACSAGTPADRAGRPAAGRLAAGPPAAGPPVVGAAPSTRQRLCSRAARRCFRARVRFRRLRHHDDAGAWAMPPTALLLPRSTACSCDWIPRCPARRAALAIDTISCREERALDLIRRTSPSGGARRRLNPQLTVGLPRL